MPQNGKSCKFNCYNRNVDSVHNLELNEKFLDKKVLTEAVEIDEKEEVGLKAGLNCVEKASVFVCGIGSATNKSKASIVFTDTSIQESRFGSMVCDIVAAISLSLCGFVFAFFNKYN